MSQTNLNNVAEEVVNDPAVVPVVDAVDNNATEVVEEAETKRKSFFDIFKKKKSTVEKTDGETEAAAVAEEAATTEEGTAEATEAAATEVPVEDAPAKKSSMCGLCAFGKKKEEPVATEEVATEEAPVEEAAVVEEPVVAATEEPVTEAAVAEEPVVAATEEPVTEAAATEEPVTTEEVVAEVPVEVARAGLLYKSGKFFKSHLNARHCRLLPTGAFQWSKTEDFSSAHEVKLCHDSTTVSFMAEGESAEHKFRFELHCCKEAMTFACDSEDDRDEWIRAIETVKEKLPVEVVEAEATEAVVEETTAAEEVATE